MTEDGGGATDSGMLGEFSSSGSRITGGVSGYRNAFSASTELNFPSSLAIDGSGNLWVSNGGNTIMEFVGLAAPVVTPILGNLDVSPYGQHAVNKP